MMLGRKKFLVFLLLFAFFHSSFILKYDFGQQTGQAEKSKIKQVEENAEKIIPSPKDIKESTGIYVFLVWMWIAIFVLVYILRLKIKEADRLYQFRFLPSKKK